MNYQSLIAIIVSVLVLDLLWLGILAKNFYQENLGNILKTPTGIPAAIGVYILLVIGIYLFVLQNNNATNTVSIILLGAVFGIVVYGVYELTNLALIKNWPIKVVLVDVLWGGILGAIASFSGSLFK